MHFEATLKNKNYEVTVTPSTADWVVCIRKTKESEWKKFLVPQKDFKEADDVTSFIFNNTSYLVDVIGSGTDYNVYTRGSYRTVTISNDEVLLHESLKSGGSLNSSEGLSAGMPGKIVKISVKEGQRVKKGDSLLIMEAMKMENDMKAAVDCTVKKVYIKTGDNVESGAQLISFEPKE